MEDRFRVQLAYKLVGRVIHKFGESLRNIGHDAETAYSASQSQKRTLESKGRNLTFESHSQEPHITPLETDHPCLSPKESL